MTDFRSYPSFSPSLRPTRSMFSVRRLALMASVVAGLGAAAYGLDRSSGDLSIFSTAAHAQVDNTAPGGAQPVGFADMVERVKPSVISVKVSMKEKAADAGIRSDEDGSGSPMERFFRQFGGPDGEPQDRGRDRRHGEMIGQGSGFFISADGFAVTNIMSSMVPTRLR